MNSRRKNTGIIAEDDLLEMFTVGNERYPFYSLGFLNNVCHVCKTFERLYWCSNCKAVAYCCREHQRIDWMMHKRICRHIEYAREKTKAITAHSVEEYVLVKKLRYMYIKENAERELYPYEMLMWMHPRSCEVCFSEKVNVICPDCKSVFFCSDNHFNQCQDHKKHCDSLKLFTERMLNVYRKGCNTKEIPILKDISMEIKNLPSNVLKFLELIDKEYVEEDVGNNISKTGKISAVASILYGLEQSDLIKNRILGKDKLVIHLVGGDMYEMTRDWTIMFELLFKWITDVNAIEYHVIGPVLDEKFNGLKFRPPSRDDTEILECKCILYPNLYHDVVDKLPKPDVVVSFNSGIHVSVSIDCEEALWKDSILHLTKHNVPLILTAYTLDELENDVKVIKENHSDTLKVVVQPLKNPFADTSPIRNFENQVSPIFYVNEYIAVLINSNKKVVKKTEETKIKK